MKIVLISFILMSLVRCSEQSVTAENAVAETVIIRSGTSFGMCIGYCNKDIELIATKATFTKSSLRDPVKYPTRTCTKTVSASKSAELVTMVQFNEFRKIPKTLDCPDCADGGAEYVEIQIGDLKHRVTFEYGKTIPGFEILVKDLRVQRDLFNDCN